MSRERERGREIGQRLLRDAFPNELLLSVDAAEVWPREIAENPEFRRQIIERQQINAHLDAVLSCVSRPDIALEDAVAMGQVAEQKIADLYTSLGELLKEGSEYQRLALYLPFEFLPSINARFVSENTRVAAIQFQANFMEAWNHLLSIHDVRANFVDGDVLEVNMRDGDLPRIVKAAHLLPKLVEKGWMTIEALHSILENNSEQILLRSLADTIPVFADMGMLDEKAIARLLAIGLPYVNEKVREAQTPKHERKQPTRFSLAELERQLRERLAQIDSEQAGYGGMTEKRIAWLKNEKKRKAILTIGGIIREKFLVGNVGNEERISMIRQETDGAMKLAYVEGVGDMIESYAKGDTSKAQSTYRGEYSILMHLWEDNVPELRDALTWLHVRLHGLHVIGDDELKVLGIVVPVLRGPFSKNLEHMQGELRDIRARIARIERDEMLSAYVYPVLLVFGSRVKGYGTTNADIDIAVFMKPEADIAKKEEIRTHLRRALRHEKLQGDAVEFWLKRDGDHLCINDGEEYDPHIGESHWTHILFGAAWEGDMRSIQGLRENLLATYFVDSGNRRIFIEEMERDALQYRLMHKGYKRYVSLLGSVHTPHADSIDGESTFWDSGYRQTATKLFVSNVFLPKLSDEK